jgi:hypothetical protein
MSNLQPFSIHHLLIPEFIHGYSRGFLGSG